MSKRYSGKSEKDSSTMKKAKLSLKEKRKIKEEKRRARSRQKGENMEIELMVQIGILGCLVFIIWFLKAWDVVQTRNWNSLYQSLDEIKEKIDYLPKV